jgi:DMSO/TMAO reductase YedYZ molybdopterin-dependent catalytic subunit
VNLSRRRLFLAAAAGVLPRLGDSADLSKMIVRSSRPEDLEMQLSGFNQWITPIDQFFVRTHAYTPEPPNLREWRLKLDGVVNQPMTLTMDDLKKMRRVEMVAVVECAGNGRSFYQPRVAGNAVGVWQRRQWKMGGRSFSRCSGKGRLERFCATNSLRRRGRSSGQDAGFPANHTSEESAAPRYTARL